MKKREIGQPIQAKMTDAGYEPEDIVYSMWIFWCHSFCDLIVSTADAVFLYQLNRRSSLNWTLGIRVKEVGGR